MIFKKGFQRSQIGLSFRMVMTAVIMLNLFAVVLIAILTNQGNKVSTQNSRLIDIAMIVKLEAAYFNLELKDQIDGYVPAETDPFRHLDRANLYLQAIKHGGMTPEGFIKKAENPLLLDMTDRVAEALDALDMKAAQLKDHAADDRSRVFHAQIRSMADHVIGLADILEEGVYKELQLQNQRFNQLSAVIIFVIILFGLFVSGVILSYEIRRKDAERALVEARDRADNANHAKSMFLASMSHDLRTPLNAIIGFSEMMHARTFGPLGHKNYEDYVNNIAFSGRQLLNLVNSILDLARIESGKKEMKDETLSVPAIVEGVLTLHGPLAQAKQIRLVNQTPTENLMLRADEGIVSQILINLVTNAIKFTPEQGQVSIAAAVSDDRSIVFRIRDTGRGMNEAEVTRALKPFEKIDDAGDSSSNGFGLGLHICNSLIEQMRGKLHIQSAPERGTTVTVQFPMDRTVGLA